MGVYWVCGGCGEKGSDRRNRCGRCQNLFPSLPTAMPFYGEQSRIQTARPSLELVRETRTPAHLLSPPSPYDRFRLNDLKLLVIGMFLPPMVLIAALYNYSERRPRTGKILLMAGILGSTAWCVLGLLALTGRVKPPT